MSLSNCSECWDTPCTCGYEYRWMSKEARINLAAVVLGVDSNELKNGVDIPERHPKEKEYENKTNSRRPT